MNEPPSVLSYNTSTPPPIVKKTYELLPLYNDKNPMLAQKQKEFDFSDSPVNVIDFANQLLYTMSHYGGIGLAAPQCGFPYRMFVLTGGIVCINPVIIESSQETVRDKEGCLSFPGLYLPITRPNTIKIKYTNEFGKEVEAAWTGATARAAQHEYDHLEGKVFTSLVGTLTLQMAKKKREKMFKKIKRIVAIKEQQMRIAGTDKSQILGHGMDRATQVQTGRQISSTAINTHREN